MHSIVYGTVTGICVCVCACVRACVRACVCLHRYLLSVSGHVGFEVVGSTEITVKEAPNLGFITTDKPVYKPGQDVHIRVFMLDHSLNAKYSNVAIVVEDPGGNKVRHAPA